MVASVSRRETRYAHYAVPEVLPEWVKANEKFVCA
jgi:hypothetical protein